MSITLVNNLHELAIIPVAPSIPRIVMVECKGCARFRWGTAPGLEVGGVVRRCRDTSREGVSNDLLFHVITAHTQYSGLRSILRSPFDQHTQSLHRALRDQSTESPPVACCYVRQSQGKALIQRCDTYTCCSESGYPTGTRCSVSA